MAEKEVEGTPTPKFIQSLSAEIYERLQKLAKERGIRIQELIRSVIIPEWLKEQERKSGKV